MINCDICIIGSGPAGIHAAIKSAKHSQLEVVVVEKADVGGICLNKGCIPTKALLHSSTLIKNLKNSSHIIKSFDKISFDFTQMQAAQRDIVSKFGAAAENSLKSLNIRIVKGEAKFSSPKTLNVGNDTEISAKSFIIATGSSSRKLPVFEGFDEFVLESDDIFTMEELPEKLLIVGAGAIGCEFADFFSALGVEVTLLEQRPNVLPEQDPEFSKRLELLFRRMGITLLLEKSIKEVLAENNQLKVVLSDGSSKSYSKGLVAVGRVFNTANICAEKANIDIDQRGCISVDKHFRTSNSSVWAVGDVIGKRLLAHAASYEADIAVSNILGKQRQADYNIVPDVVYTSTELASVGLSFKDIQKDDTLLAIKGRFATVAKAHIEGCADGIFKLIYEKDSGIIKGASLYCKNAGEMISLFTLAIQNKTTIEQLKEIVFPHPTLSEAISVSLE